MHEKNAAHMFGEQQKKNAGVAIMMESYEVALIGFSRSEVATFETFFRLVSSRRPRPFRVTTQISGAHAVMVCTNETVDIERAFAEATAAQPVIAVGARRVANVWRQLDRPINLNAVLVTLDAAVVAETSPPRAAATIAPPPARVAPPPAALVPNAPLPNRSQFHSPAPQQRGDLDSATSTPASPAHALPQPPERKPVQLAPPVAPVSSAAASSNNVAAFARTMPTSTRAIAPATSTAPSPKTESPSDGIGASRVSILVVDDSDVALKFIHSRLSAFGFHVDKCTSGEEALVRVSDGRYQFVFLDVMMEGLDGYQTCKAIKGRRYPRGQTPVVVMLTSRGGTIDKVRGTFAGCDGYLTKPLDETKMLKILLKHDPNIGESISTMAPNTIAAPAPATIQSRESTGDPLAASYASLRDRAR